MVFAHPHKASGTLFPHSVHPLAAPLHHTAPARTHGREVPTQRRELEPISTDTKNAGEYSVARRVRTVRTCVASSVWGW